jgi:hypothetical protein
LEENTCKDCKEVMRGNDTNSLLISLISLTFLALFAKF